MWEEDGVGAGMKAATADDLRRMEEDGMETETDTERALRAGA